MGEQLEYVCQHCRGKFTGMLHGYFVTGIVDVVCCSLFCLVQWVNEHQDRIEAAQEREIGGSG